MTNFYATFALALLVSSPLSQAQEPAFNERPALPFKNTTTLQSQCGILDDLQHVEFYDGTLGVSKAYVDTHERSTVQLQWLSEAGIRAKLPQHLTGDVAGERWCTAALIGTTTLLTAGHCFDIARGENGWVTPFEIDANGNAVSAEPATLATLFVVNFGYQLSAANGQLRKPDVFPVTHLTEYRKGNLDYAIVELGLNSDGKSPVDLGHKIAALDIRDVNATERLTIIQHPQGDPKKIESGSAQGTFGSELFYDNIDTHGGSSGSCVRDSDGECVAVHTNGGCLPTGGGANRGVLLKSISAASGVL